MKVHNSDLSSGEMKATFSTTVNSRDMKRVYFWFINKRCFYNRKYEMIFFFNNVILIYPICQLAFQVGSFISPRFNIMIEK